MSMDISPEERSEFIGEFLAESEAHLEVLNEKLLAAEDAFASQQEMSEEELNGMFRAAHTVKGTASFIGLTRVVNLTHELETILQRLKKREMELSSVVIDVLFEGVDLLQSLIKDLTETAEENTDIDECVTRIQCVLEGKPIESKSGGASVQEVVSSEKPAEIISAEMSEEDRKYIGLFISDTEQNIDELNELFTTLEQDLKNSSVIDESFRMLHTIKGSAGVVGQKKIQKLAHAMENILSVARQRREAFENMFALMYEGLDMLSRMTRHLLGEAVDLSKAELIIVQIEAYALSVTEGKMEDVEDATPSILVKEETLLEAIASDKVLKANLEEELVQKRAFYYLEVLIESSIPMKGMKAALVEEHLKDFATVLIMSPSVDDINDTESKEITLKIIIATSVTEHEVKNSLYIDGIFLLKATSIDINQKIKPLINSPEQTQETNIKEDTMEHSANETPTVVEVAKDPVEVQKTSAPVQVSTIRIDTRKLDTLMNLSGELVTVRARFDQIVNLFSEEAQVHRAVMRMFDEVFDDYEYISKTLRQKISTDNNDSSDIKLIKLMDRLENRLQVLEQQRNDMQIISRIHTLDETTGSLGKIASSIQSGVMQTRMVPIEGVFTRFKRIVRDISKDLNKQVVLEVSGEDTELDKKLVDSLGDPLTHMIRNAVDHGIENPQDRVKAGKPEQGTVFLKASHRGNNVCIEIGDDGKGLDADSLAQSALKKELVTEDQILQMSDREKLNLMFLPGFSTAAQVTDISGRGVGMDVVKNMINEVNGVVDIETELGKGTTFVMKIPLTLAIIQVLLVKIGAETYAFPLEAVTEIIKVNQDDVYSIDGNETVKLRDHALSLVELEDTIKLKEDPGVQRETKRVVVITDGELQLGVVVDSLIGESEIVIKSLSHHFSSVKGVSGATILGDGQVALILDPVSIIMESK